MMGQNIKLFRNTACVKLLRGFNAVYIFLHFRLRVTDFPPIKVKYLRGEWFTHDNRRLWVFRHLEKLGKCSHIKVEVSKATPCISSSNDGYVVKVRGDIGGEVYNDHFIDTSRRFIRGGREPESMAVTSYKHSTGDATNQALKIGTAVVAIGAAAYFGVKLLSVFNNKRD